MSELKENILKLRKSGLTYDKIKNELKCSKSTISYHCEKNGIGENYLKYKDFNIDKKDIDKVVELRNSGELYSTIRNITKLSLDKIKFICRNNNINNDYQKTYKVTDNLIIEMQKYYDECGSSTKVGERFGLNRQTVCKYIVTNKKGKMTEEESKKSKSKNVVNWRKDKKIKLIEYKGGCCEMCGYNKCVSALDFHHKDPKEKDFAISGKSYSFERLKKEVDKCILVCRNCHAEIHESII